MNEVFLHGMRLFITGKGRVGVAHAQAARGDNNCFIRGLNLPIILRRAESSAEKYHIVGEAYVAAYQPLLREDVRDWMDGGNPRDFSII
jgi:hypothetical protein